MFNDIAKILQTIKKGIVVVENGAPSYVLIPWDDVISGNNREAVKRVKEGVNTHHITKRDMVSSFIDDTSLIQQIVNEDVPAHLYDNFQEEDEIIDILNKMDEENGNRKAFDYNEQINLEDLPF